MPNFDPFARFLKRMGKKENVAQELIRDCEKFARYLEDKPGKSLDQASVEDLLAFTQEIERQGLDAKNILRGLALYYKFSANPLLSGQANRLREERLAAGRPKFNLRDFRGLDPQHLARLEALGIRTTEQMLSAGRSPTSRQTLAEKSGLAPETILEMVKLSDLARLEGVKAIRARLYFDAGLDSLEKLANRDPQVLHRELAAFVQRTGFEGIPPLPKELENTVRRAKELEKIVEFE
jgi:hypothetical protein